jgi:outer membrane protein OmpA-like peptidoglycan-associated protein/outer membrane protein W
MEQIGGLLKAWGDSSIRRGLTIFFLFMLCALATTAQTREGRWVLGVQGGGHTLFSDFDTHKYDLGGEAFLRYGLSENFSLGFLTGYNDIEAENSYLLTNMKGLGEDLHVIPATLMGWLHFTSMKDVSPYVYVGAGIAALKKQDGISNYDWQTYALFPVGVGVEIPLNSQTTLGVDLGLRVFASNNVPRQEAPGEEQDWWPDAYGTARVGLNFYFGGGKPAEVQEVPPVVLPPPAPVAQPVVPAPPLPPVLATPTNGATGVATNPTLTWNASSGATSYRLQASTDSTFASTTADQSGITTTSYSLSGLAAGTTYYWRVNATNSAGTSAYSTTWSLTTAAPPPPPVPVVPKVFVLEGVNFDFNKATLTSTAVNTLEKAFTILQDNPGLKVKIVGHTDNIGSKKYNDGLSLRRANAVKSWLVSKGIDSARLTTAGVGFSEPIATNDTPEGRAKNRRIEFHVVE